MRTARFRACHPRDRLGLDSLVHAGRRGNWWALVTDGKPSGHPVVQGRSDPAPGYISMTALCDSENPNPRDRVEPSYIDAVTIRMSCCIQGPSSMLEWATLPLS